MLYQCVCIAANRKCWPHMTGDELASRIRRIRPGIPVILRTGFSEKIASRGGELDIDKLLIKPVENEAMGITVRKVLDEAAEKATSSL